MPRNAPPPLEAPPDPADFDLADFDLADFDLAGFLPYRLAVAAQKLSEGLARRYRRDFGISIPEWRVLAHLSQASEVSVRDIERRAAMEKSKVSRAVARLVDNGLVRKEIDPADKRLLRLSLTESGRALMAKLIPMARAYQTRLESLLGAERDIFDTALARILEEEV